MNSRKIICLIIIFSLLALSACDYMPIDKLAIVTGLGIDKGEDSRYLVTAEIARMEGGESGKLEPHIVTGKGDTIAEAISMLGRQAGGRLYTAHCSVVIIGEALASENLSDTVKSIYKLPKFSPLASVAVSRNCDANRIMNLKPVMRSLISEEISGIMEAQYDEAGIEPRIHVYEVYSDISGGRTPALPSAHADEEEKVKMDVFYE